ncbi:MAG: M20 family metallo-hydrolase [Sedimentibacter sp.]
MNINENRIARYFNYICSQSSTELGCTRLSYSNEDLLARQFIIDELNQIGADVKIDSVGNIRAVYNPDKLNTKSLLIGSHIDTVPNGGRYDGLTGSVCSLEVLKVLYENNVKLKHPVELVIFSEEEGSNFGVTMIGSKYMAKKIQLDDLRNLYNDDGKTAYDYILGKGFQFNPEKDCFVEGKYELGMIELHVEQGGILDKRGLSLGIVQAIAGMNTLQVTVKGKSNHAGTTPMNFRKDSLLAASEMIYKLSNIVACYETAVITVGKINVFPNASNVIAAETVFNIDIRDVIQESIDKISEDAKTLCMKISHSNGVDTTIKLIGSSKVVYMDDILVETIERQANKHSLSNIRMNSGAVHDNAMLNGIIPTAMIFVPSIDGISHSPYEDTKFTDIIAGAELLLHTVVELVS